MTQTTPPDAPARVDALHVDALHPVSARYAGGAAAGLHAGEHVITARNRWSRAVLAFRGLSAEAWHCLSLRLTWDAAEGAALATDFAFVGFDVLMGDGSSLDVEAVRGLARTLLDPHGAWLPGPAYHPQGGGRSALLRVAFRAPPLAEDLAVSIRSWRNTQAFTVSECVLEAGAAEPGPPPRRLGPVPEVLRHALVPGAGLVLRGQIVAGRPDEHAARVSLAYHDADGARIPPPYPGTVSVPGLDASINLAAAVRARRFTLDLSPPPAARTVEIGFGTWEEEAEADRPAVVLPAAPEVALPDALRLESLCGDEGLGGGAFLERLCGRLGLEPGGETGWAPAPAEAGAGPLALARSLRRGPERPAASGPDGRPALGLAREPAWSLPEEPDWREDPYRSVPWRLEYQSLAWLTGLPGSAMLALSWARANPWGQPADPLSLHPDALAARAEVLALILAREGAHEGAEAGPILLAAGVQHGVALAEIVGQSAFGRSLHGLQAAAALLVLARAVPALPLSAYWTSLGGASLGATFAALLGPDGHFTEPGLHRRLELLGLGRALAAWLDGAEPGPAIAARVEAALPALASLLDPGGRLPAFGDWPHDVDAAGWIGRLAAPDAPALVAARENPRPEPVSCPDAIARRYDAPGRGFAHFACTFAEQGPQGHADCTSFVYAADGLRWIVDAGGEGGEAGPARHYLLSARAHNVAVPDGREPVAGSARLRDSLRLDGATAHALSTTVHGPGYGHERIVVLADDLDALAVLDRFEGGDGPITFEGFLHLAPEALAAVTGPRRVIAQQGGRRLDLVPWAVAGSAAGLQIINGRADRPGLMQGFVARPPGPLAPASTLSYAFAGRGIVCGGLLIGTGRSAQERMSALLRSADMARFIAGR